jgi:8-oxo-dGTP diphosphatase
MKIICKDRNNKEYKVDSQDVSFRPSVYGIVIKDNKILLSKQWDGYDFPGGGVEIQETVDQALIREFHEETGFDIKVGKIISCHSSFFKFLDINKYSNTILIYYLCKITGGQISKEFLDEHEQQYADLPEWIDIDQIDKIKFYNSVDSVAIIKEAMALKNKL